MKGKKQITANEPLSSILVIDDEKEICEFLEDFLSANSFSVVTVQNPVQALRLLEDKAFDLILTDLIMPKIDGIAFTKLIRENGIQTPVVVMTGYASIDYAVESMKAGAADFIPKPLKIDHVLLIIKKVMDARRIQRIAQEGEYYKKISNLDPLTSIGNYRYLEQILPIELDRHRRYKRTLTLMMIDIDDFKTINDSYGHQVGDHVLLEVATLMKKTVRNCDFVIRYGGEEFVIILPELATDQAVYAAQRIVKKISRHRFVSSHGKRLKKVTVTIGMSTFPKDGKEKTILIKRADEALYFGKKEGKNCLSIYGKPFQIFHADHISSDE